MMPGLMAPAKIPAPADMGVQITGDHYRIGQSLVICHDGVLSIRKKNFTRIYNKHLSADAHRWMGSFATRCSASRTRFFCSFRIFRGRCGSVFPRSLQSGPVIFGQTMLSSLNCTLPDLAPEKNLDGPPLRDLRTFVSLATEGTSASASRSAVVPQ